MGLRHRDAARRGGAVPPRIGADRVGPGAARQLPRPARRHRRHLTATRGRSPPRRSGRRGAQPAGAVDRGGRDGGRGGRGGGRGGRLADLDVDRAPAGHLGARGGVLAVDVAGLGAVGAPRVEGGVGHQAGAGDGRGGGALRLPDHAGDRDAVAGRDDEVDGGVRCTLMPEPGSGPRPARWAGSSRPWSGCPRSARRGSRVVPALAGDWPSTLGTGTELCVPETVRATLRVRGSSCPPPGSGSAPCPPAGCWSRCGRCSRDSRPGGARWPG